MGKWCGLHVQESIVVYCIYELGWSGGGEMYVLLEVDV